MGRDIERINRYIALNIRKKEGLQHIFKNITEIKERNIEIAKAYKQGYSQFILHSD